MALLSLGWYSGAFGIPWVHLVFLGCFWCSLGASIMVEMLLVLHLWFLVSHASFSDAARVL
jgi:hypothetical protein